MTALPAILAGFLLLSPVDSLPDIPSAHRLSWPLPHPLAETLYVKAYPSLAVTEYISDQQTLLEMRFVLEAYEKYGAQARERICRDVIPHFAEVFSKGRIPSDAPLLDDAVRELQSWMLEHGQSVNPADYFYIYYRRLAALYKFYRPGAGLQNGRQLLEKAVRLSKPYPIRYEALQDDWQYLMEEMDSLSRKELTVKTVSKGGKPVSPDEKPSFNGGGMLEFSKWVSSHLVYPERAKRAGIQGCVTVAFTVEKDGSVTRVSIAKSVDPDLDAEALRVIRMSPKWWPGTLYGHPYSVQCTFPVYFELNDSL